MTPEHEFIEDLIEIRSKLKKQLGLIEAGKMGTGGAVAASASEATKARLKRLIEDFNDLLKENASADRT
ncbi:hypothetical protein [Methylocapsa palsarum]|uniref:Uncharacterized protein n=1 Tax=Methylocapsa palsarum TaxID=1612308 RepID=A0A1I3Z577_9HYPH|nr:hypothetical protein [Methylocapsa palsarum]SFK39264.1 hypothetical protein SAMN05444581_10783 [Methylocapsa palsarum]